MFKKISLAPLFKYTDRHCIYFYNLLSKNIKFYTGMIHTSSFLRRYNNKKIFFLKKLNIIQFIGNNYELLECAKIINKLNFDEINFNIGCPSIKSEINNTGAVLMLNIKKVINCINYLYDGAPNLLISLKQRLGIGNFYCYNSLLDFVSEIVFKTNCRYFILHAKNAILSFNKKKNNNNIFRYDFVYRLKKDLPFLKIIINGGINSINEINNHLKYVDGVMIGKSIYFRPLFIFEIDFFLKKKEFFFYKKNCFLKFYLNYSFIKKIFEKMYFYIKNEINKGVNSYNILKHMLHIFYGFKNSSSLKRRLLESSKIFTKFKNFSNFEKFLLNKNY